MGETIRWFRKIGEEIMAGQNKKRKKEIKIGKDF
jgi:hypothetical protein